MNNRLLHLCMVILHASRCFFTHNLRSTNCDVDFHTTYRHYRTHLRTLLPRLFAFRLTTHDSRPATVFHVALCTLFLIACQSPDTPAPANRHLHIEAEPLSVGGDFTLTDHNGQPFHLKDQKRPILLFFGYANCPDFCPQTLARIAQVYALMNADAQNVLTVFISIDPDRDTPALLKTYLSHFNVPAIGLTGPRDSLNAIVKRYGAFYEQTSQPSAAGPIFDHSLYIYLLDKSGNTRFLFRPTDTAEDIATVIRQLKS